jgi:predicted DNA-binding protein with PD1-like motif
MSFCEPRGKPRLLTGKAESLPETMIFSLKAGARLHEEVTAIARREKISTAGIKAIGSVKELRLSYYNRDTKKYEDHDFKGLMEVVSLVGNITMKDDKMFLHAHGNFARRDLSVIGGHVTSAVIFPRLEVFLTPIRNTARRRFDESLGLNVIYNL